MFKRLKKKLLYSTIKELEFSEIVKLIIEYKRWLKKEGCLDEYYNFIVFLQEKRLIDVERVKKYVWWR